MSRRPVPRRAVLGLAAATPILMSCGRATTVPAPPPGVPNRVHTRWRARPDGPIPPRGDEGLDIQVNARQGTPPTVVGGALVGNLPDRPSATYVLQNLPGKVRRVGAEFGFGPGSTDGSLGLIAWVPHVKATGHCHIALTPDRWVAGIMENGELTEYDRGDYRFPLVQDGRPYRAEVVVADATTYISLPDGTVIRSGDEAVGRLNGSVPCWEFSWE